MDTSITLDKKSDADPVSLFTIKCEITRAIYNQKYFWIAAKVSCKLKRIHSYYERLTVVFPD